MRMPVVLRGTHEAVVSDLKEIIVNRNEAIEKINKDLAGEKEITEILENRNSQLNVKLVVADTKLNKAEDDVHRLNMEINDLEEKIENLKSQKMNVSNRLKRIIHERNELKDEKVYLEHDLNQEKLNSHVFKSDIIAIGTMYNNMNRKLWNNEESKRQLRQLAVDIRDGKYNLRDAAKYIEEISMHVGGGEQREFRIITEKDKAQG